MLKFVSTHSRAEAAAYNCPIRAVLTISVSTHSRAEAAAKDLKGVTSKVRVSTHSRAEAAARWIAVTKPTVCWFQHTAARRRLPCFYGFLLGKGWCFNTQPRGGGCTRKLTKGPYSHCVSTHSRAEAAACRHPSD